MPSWLVQSVRRSEQTIRYNGTPLTQGVWTRHGRGQTDDGD
jgi:hypothetical protein